MMLVDGGVFKTKRFQSFLHSIRVIQVFGSNLIGIAELFNTLVIHVPIPTNRFKF
jgi:hypothetical protein